MSGPGAAERAEHALVPSLRRDITVTVVAVVLTAAAFVAVAEHGALARIQPLDDAWMRTMISNRSGPVTACAKVLNELGLVDVTLPELILIARVLALRR